MKSNKVLKALVIITLLNCVYLVADEAEDLMKTIEAANIFETVRELSSPAFMGRLSGHIGYDRAAELVKGRLQSWGLKPVYDGYYRSFYVDYNDLGESSVVLYLPAADAGEGILRLKLMEDYIPELYTGFGEVSGEIVFAGYGITAPDQGWDDYAGQDVKGKIVLLLAGFPEIKGKDFSKYWESGRHKYLNARERGALAVMRVASIGGVVGDRYVEGLPMIRLSDSAASLLLKPKGYNLKTLKAKLDTGENVVFPTGVRADIKTTGIHYPKARTSDVIAMIEGSDPELKNEYVIIGAHLDHVGSKPVLFSGANDNASGVAVVMEIAKAFSRLGRAPKRSVVFTLFAAEERGPGGGSSSMLNDMPKFPTKPVWMVNFDVVGVGDRVDVAGATEEPELFRILEEVKKEYSIACNMVAVKNVGEYARSDHTSFQARRIPAYGNETNGQNYGYHTGKDTIYNITPQIMEDIARLYFAVVYRYLDR